MAKREVLHGKDGFFRVSGQPLETYYSDAVTAQRVAHNLEEADAASDVVDDDGADLIDAAG
jgi:hypothetical protein